MCRLTNPSPTLRLQVALNQGCKSIFDIFFDDLLVCHQIRVHVQGVSERAPEEPFKALLQISKTNPCSVL